MRMEDKYVFHVHTKRCGHAQEIEDEAYVKKALEFGSESIYFTDHAPFPEDPFRNRMRYEELDEYITSLKEIRDKYMGKICVHIGLEIEYLPSYDDYYKQLRNMDEIELLILGQHHAETPLGKYTFELEDKSDEWKYLMEGQIAGTKSGYFDVVAHPDRIFKREKKWTPDMETEAKRFLDVATKKRITIERNIASMYHDYQYWDEFWELVPEDLPVIVGSDAHTIDDLVVGIYERRNIDD